MTCEQTPQCPKPCGLCPERWPVPAGQPVDRAEALAQAFSEALDCLKGHNENRAGPIIDTIWYTPHETLFDFMESSLETFRAASVQAAPAQGEQAADDVAMAWNTVRAEARLLAGEGQTIRELLAAVEQYGERLLSTRPHPAASVPAQVGGVAVPAGYKLVPVVPTDDMLAALWAYKSDSLEDCYRAVLQAAPSPAPAPAATTQPLRFESAEESRKDREHAEAYYRQAERLLTSNEATLHAENERLRATLSAQAEPQAAADGDLIAAAKRVSWKFGHDEAGVPSDWSEWVDLRAEIAAAEAAPAPAQPAGYKCSRCGSATTMGCNEVGCFALEGQDPAQPELFGGDVAPPWMLTGDSALRISYEHRVTAGAVQDIAKALYSTIRAAAQQLSEAEIDARFWREFPAGSKGDKQAFKAGVRAAMQKGGA